MTHYSSCKKDDDIRKYICICLLLQNDTHEGKSETKETGHPQRVGGQRVDSMAEEDWGSRNEGGGPFLNILFCIAPTTRAKVMFHTPQNKQLQSTRTWGNKNGIHAVTDEPIYIIHY